MAVTTRTTSNKNAENCRKLFSKMPWMDRPLASSKLYKDTISLKFASDPYFKLLDTNPKHAEWLSLGQPGYCN